jgi:hypothetical protein
MKSRNGSYKKILLEPDILKSHGDYLRLNLLKLKELELSHANYLTLYILLFLRIKHPKNWLQKKTKLNSKNNLDNCQLLTIIPESFKLNEWEKLKLKDLTAYSLFSDFNLKAIPESINRSMINWIEGLWKINLLEYIPIPRELLAMQVLNTRCVTVITDPEKIDLLVRQSRDPLSFVLHDLMHADQFFRQIDSQKGQLGFYQLIQNVYDKAELKKLLKNDKVFKNEFEYVTTDMNAYVIHLFKCLKSSIFRTDPLVFENLLDWWGMSLEEKNASNNLSSPNFDSSDEMRLREFFEKSQVIL